MGRVKWSEATAMLLVLLASITACNADDEEPKSAPKTDSRPCEALIGRSGVDWAKSKADLGAKGVEYSGTELREAKANFQAHAWSWSPDKKDGDALLLLDRDDMCRIYPAGMSLAQQHVLIRYGASSIPFSQVNRREIGSPSKVIDVNSDVRLVLWEYKDRRREQSVYVKCKVRDAVPQQEAGLPIEGSITDRITGERDDTHRLTYLLRSAGVVAKAFGCLNKPTVPTELPAGWASSSG